MVWEAPITAGTVAPGQARSRIPAGTNPSWAWPAKLQPATRALPAGSGNRQDPCAAHTRYVHGAETTLTSTPRQSNVTFTYPHQALVTTVMHPTRLLTVPTGRQHPSASVDTTDSVLWLRPPTRGLSQETTICVLPLGQSQTSLVLAEVRCTQTGGGCQRGSLGACSPRALAAFASTPSAGAGIPRAH